MYYITSIKPNAFGTGISYKIAKQIDIFKANNFDVQIINVSKTNNKFKQRMSVLPFINWNISLKELRSIEKNSYVYIRYFLCNYKLLKELKKVKKSKENIKIAIEIPTYPYDGEYSGTPIKVLVKLLPFVAKDRLTRNKLKKYVDRIVTFSDDKKIFGINTINISNGVDLKKIQIRKPLFSRDKRSINMIAVAKFGYWHGYDRMIEGMGQYYHSNIQDKRKITFYIVGYGNNEIEKQYRLLISKYHLENRVILAGKKSGKELDDLYNICNLGIDSMGRHRSGVNYNSSLKGKEYLAKGLPIVSGVCTELDYMPNYKYYYRVPADNTPVNISSIVKFYDSIYSCENEEKVTKKIRIFCEENFSIDKCLSKVIAWYNK